MIFSRLASLDRKSALSSQTEEPGIVRETTFSTIPSLDRFLRANKLAIWLHTLIQQADSDWTVGQVVIISLALICVGALLGNWWITGGLLGWIPGVALGTTPFLYL